MSTSAIVYAIGAFICLASADFFLKLSAGRISSSLGTLIYAITAVVPAAIWVAWQKFSNEPLQITREGALASIAVGISFSLVVVFLSLTFANGANLSIASPVIRLLGIVLASSLGILVLGETVTWRYAFGVALTFAGIYFIVTR
ncbi:MAG: EamA family transporter [Chloroflexi bacterium]|nr:EamA family transporter [Chloroflexota bacterium]